jgi:hypothetical protein
MAAVFGHWTPDCRGAIIPCSVARHAPHTYSNSIPLQAGAKLPHNQSVKSVHGATWPIFTFDPPNFGEGAPSCRV